MSEITAKSLELRTLSIRKNIYGFSYISFCARLHLTTLISMLEVGMASRLEGFPTSHDVNKYVRSWNGLVFGGFFLVVNVAFEDIEIASKRTRKSIKTDRIDTLYKEPLQKFS